MEEIISEEITRLNNPFFSLRFAHSIHEFFFCKNIILENFSYTNFLLIETKISFMIFRKSKRKIYKKLIALPTNNFGEKKVLFDFLFENDCISDKSVDNLKGALFSLKNNKLMIYYIRNLFTKSQALIEDKYEVDLENFNQDQIISVMSYESKKIKIITYTNNFIFIKYRLDVFNSIMQCSVQYFKLLNKSVKIDKIIYGPAFKSIYGKLKFQNEIFLKLKNYYDRSFHLKIIINDKNDILSGFWFLIEQDVLVHFNLTTKCLEVFQIFSNQEIIQLKENYFLEFLENHEVKIIKFVNKNKNLFYSIIKNDERFIIKGFEIKDFKITNIINVGDIFFNDVTENKIEFIEMILQQQDKNLFRFILSTLDKEVITFDVENSEIKNKKRIIFEKNILEIYKNRKHPYNYIILTNDNILHFYDNNLELHSQFDLSIMNIDLKNNPNNFNLKNLYDNFYILYVFKDIKIGCLKFFKKDNKFKFFIIEYEDFYLKQLNYTLNLNSEFKDKIVFFNHTNICIRNDESLVYGSLILNSKSLEKISKKTFDMNLHKYILLENYHFSFFRTSFVYEILKKGQHYFLYQFLIRAMQDKKNTHFDFDPEFIYENLYLTKEEFLNKNDFFSDNQFYDFLEEQKNRIAEFSEEKKIVFEKTLAILNDLKSNIQSLDFPSKIFYIEMVKRKSEKIEISSEMIVMAICSDQKDFIFNHYLPNDFQNTPDWEEMKKFCVIYWFDNINKLKQLLDRAMMIKYKKDKNVFDILFWFVLFGKTKLLVPLFKLEPGQDKFVKFFASDFKDPQVIQRTISNAYVLKSQKKFDLCVAFFLIVNSFSEAINIILVYMNDPQLAILVYRVFENLIIQNESQKGEIQNLFRNYFIEKAESSKEFFLMAIGYKILNEEKKMLECLKDANNYTNNIIWDKDLELQKNLGFKFCNFSSTLDELFSFVEKSASLKRFYVEMEKGETEYTELENGETENRESDTNKLEKRENETNKLEDTLWNNFMYYYTNDSIYMALIYIIKIKIKNKDLFEKLVRQNKIIFQEIFKRLGLKKLKSLIIKNSYWRFNDKFEKLYKWMDFFYLEKEKVEKKINNRVFLINDFELNLFNKINANDYKKTEKLFESLIDIFVSKINNMLNVDIFKYISCHKWILKISFVEKFVEMLNNLFVTPNQIYLDIYRKYKDDFDSLIVFWLFLITLQTNCWEESLFILENFKLFDILSTEFENFLTKVKTKIKSKYIFFTEKSIHNTSNLKINFSNINLLVFLFTKNLYFSSFLKIKKKIILDKDNIIDLRMGQNIELFKFSLKKNLIKVLGTFSYEEKNQIKDELINIFKLDITNLKRTNFYVLSPKEALELDLNERVTCNSLNLEEWYEVLNEYNIYSLLEDDYKNLSRDKFEERKKFFGKGIQIFKIKQEQNPINFFSAGIITKTIIFRNELSPDIYILINKKIRKVYLFNSLFKKMRTHNGYNLNRYDDLNSISVVNEMPSILSEGFLSEKPLVLRIIFNFLFKGSPSQKNKHSSKIFEKIIDQKIQKTDDFSNVNFIENHKELPILFIAQNNKFFIISKKTLATLCSFTEKSIKKIKTIIPDNLGYKILLIDSERKAFILKYDLTFSNIILIQIIEGKNIYSGDWIENSTKIFFTTYTNKVIIFDIIEFKIVEMDLEDIYLTKNLVISCKTTNNLFLINKSKATVTSLNDISFDIENTYKPKAEAITSYLLDDDKKILILGHSNGEIRIVDLKRLEEIDVQSFEFEEKKKYKIENLVFLGDFVMASFSNGLLSIIGKI